MFHTLKRLAARSTHQPMAPPDTRIYAIGDVHGRDDLLTKVAARIASDLNGAPRRVVTVFLGDYVDRGRGSRAVIELLSKGDFPTELVALRGNHEQVMLEALADPAVFDRWRKYGGLETLVSYDVDVSEVMRGLGYEEARDSLLRQVPAAHRAFLENLPHSMTIGDYFFCHAGVRPGTPTAHQDSRDLLWIRDAFLSAKQPFDKYVVHGHTPVEFPDIRSNRANLDTGAYMTGMLACLVLEGDDRRILRP